MQQKTKSKTEKAKIQANIVAVQNAHPRQPRCQYFGEEIQMDACKHVWFGASYSHLHVALDDSTGNIVGGYFDKEETLNGYYMSLNKYSQNMEYLINLKQIKELFLI